MIETPIQLNEDSEVRENSSHINRCGHNLTKDRDTGKIIQPKT